MWLLVIVFFSVLHAIHLQADFPNHSPWSFDYAKYTDEGWYGDAAVRAHLLGHWYLPGDFNPAPAVPLWPVLQWILFAMTGVSMVAARGLAVALFFLELVLAYGLVRSRGGRWTGLLAVTFMVMSPFLYAFSRLAILEPLLVVLTLAALNVVVRLPRFRHPIRASIAVGVLYGLMLLTKTTAVFLAPAVGWALLAPLWRERRTAIRCASAALGTAAALYGAWLVLVVRAGLLPDYRYFFHINRYAKPTEWYGFVLSLWWCVKGCLWADRILLPLTAVALAILALSFPFARRSLLAAASCVAGDPAFGACVLAALGYVLFMAVQNHPQPRYYVVVAVFAFLVLAMGIEALLASPAAERARPARLAGVVVLAGALIASAANGARTLIYAAHPEYTFVTAARRLTGYIDAHPNGHRMLLSVSGDEIAMITGLPGLCDQFGTQRLADKLARYSPGWWATWNDVDPITLEALHRHYTLEQVASFRAFDDPERNVLVLFKLHPLPPGRLPPRDADLRQPLPGDTIGIEIE